MHVTFDLSNTNLAILIGSFVASYLWCLLVWMRAPIRVADEGIGYAYLAFYGGILAVIVGLVGLIFHSMFFGVIGLLLLGVVAAAFTKVGEW